MVDIWITYGNRKNGCILDMNASVGGSGEIIARGRVTNYGWVIEPVDPELSYLMTTLDGDTPAEAENLAYSALRKIAHKIYEIRT